MKRPTPTKNSQVIACQRTWPYFYLILFSCQITKSPSGTRVRVGLLSVRLSFWSNETGYPFLVSLHMERFYLGNLFSLLIAFSVLVCLAISFLFFPSCSFRSVFTAFYLCHFSFCAILGFALRTFSILVPSISQRRRAVPFFWFLPAVQPFYPWNNVLVRCAFVQAPPSTLTALLFFSFFLPSAGWHAPFPPPPPSTFRNVCPKPLHNRSLPSSATRTVSSFRGPHQLTIRISVY